MKRRTSISIAITGLLGATNAHAQQCASSCEGANGYYAPHEDREKLARDTDPIVRELRACLDGAGGRAVNPAVVIRFDSEGKVANARVEAGGYESLPCVAQATAKLQRLTLTHETTVRCGCGLPSASPPPTPAPAPVPPPPSWSPPQINVAPPPQPPPYYYGPAPQQPPPAYAPMAPPREKVWYGWQTLVVDAGTLGIAGIAVGTQSRALGTVGLVGFVIGAPIVHFVHGNVGPGFGSMSYRLFLPLIGMGIGALVGLGYKGGIYNGSGDLGDAYGSGSTVVNGAVTGAFIGMGICVILDAAALAWEKKEVDVARHRNPSTRISVSPFGVSGVF